MSEANVREALAGKSPAGHGTSRTRARVAPGATSVIPTEPARNAGEWRNLAVMPFETA